MRLSRRVLLVAVGICAWIAGGSATHAAPGDTLRQIRSPAPCATGLTWAHGVLWIADHKLDALIALDPRTGKELRRLRSPGYRPMGLAAGRKLLWSADLGTGWIYGLDPRTGVTRVSFEAPVSRPVAVAWSKAGLWLSGRGHHKIRLIDPADGTTIRTTPVPGRSADGLAWDGRYLWVTDRLADKVYMMDPWRGEVIFAFKSPGPYPTGIAFDGRTLWIADYQTDRLTQVVRRDRQRVRRRLRRHEALELTVQLRNYGPDPLGSADLILALPGRHPTFTLDQPLVLSPKGSTQARDRWGQRAAHFHFRNVRAGRTVEARYRTRVSLYDVRYFPFPHRITTLRKIPARIRARYLVDGAKYRIHDWRIQKAVRKALGNEKNPYWMARRLYRYVHRHMHYALQGGWNVAPRVLARGSGSCSEYSFVFIALCRAAGIPARYVGSLVVRRDDASWDDVFHRWVEIYLPGFGWLPVDPSRGDKPTEAARGDGFHHLTPDFVVTTQSGGGSRLLRWTYNYDTRWTCKGRCLVRPEAIAEWAPIPRRKGRR